MFQLSISSGRARCPLCGKQIKKDLRTVRARLGSGKYARTYHEKCFIREYSIVMKALVDQDERDFEEAYQIMMDCWQYVPDDMKEDVNERLVMCNL